MQNHNNEQIANERIRRAYLSADAIDYTRIDGGRAVGRNDLRDSDYDRMIATLQMHGASA